MPRYKLIYFNARGRAEVARMLFALANVDYEDQRLNKEEWLAFKSSKKPQFLARLEALQKTPYGQLPILEVDGVQIAQTMAINRYLAREFGFAGKTSLDQALVDMQIIAMDDLVKPMMEAHLCQDKTKKVELMKVLCNDVAPKYLSKFEEALLLNDGYLVGGAITMADLLFVTGMSWFEKVVPSEIFATFPKLKELVIRVESLPRIAAWIAKRPTTEN